MLKISYKLKYFLISFCSLIILSCLFVFITDKPVVTHAEGTIELSIVNIYVPDHVYDGNMNVELEGGELQGVQEGDDVSFILNAGVAEQYSVGENISVTTNIELIGVDASKYVLIQPSLSVNIVPREITIKDVVANERVYDGTTSVLLSDGTLEGVLPDDDVSFVLNSGEVADKSVGDNKTVVTNIVLSGEDCLNYILHQPKNIVVNILPKSVTISDLEAVDREYDGTRNVDIIGGTLEGIIPSDDVSFTCGQATVDDKAVGIDKVVSIHVQLNGVDSNNYILQGLQDIHVNITQKSLSVIGVVATNRVYDGTTSVLLSRGTLEGVLPDDDVSFVLNSGEVADKSVGDNKTVITNIVLSGEDCLNYVLHQPTNIVVNILPKSVTISDLEAVDREYDGTSNVDVVGGTLEGIIPSDDVSFTCGQATVDDKAVGIDKVVSIDVQLNGVDSNNYILQGLQDIHVNITQKSLSVIGVAATNRVYDGTTSVLLLGGTLQGVITGDDVVLNLGEGVIQDKNVGTQKVVITNISILGGDSSNYSIIQPDLYVDITAKNISIINVFASNREINRKETVELLGGTLIGVIDGDSVDFSLGLGTIADTGKGIHNVTTSISLTGEDSVNYILEQPLNISVELFAKDTNDISTFFIVLTIILSLLIGVMLFYFLKLRRVSIPKEVAVENNDTQPYIIELQKEISRLNQIALNFKQQINDAIIEKNKLANAYSLELGKIREKLSSLEQELKEKESIVDVIPILGDAILPFVEKVLNTIHKAEDENLAETFFIKSIRNSLNIFLMQSLNIDGIEVVYSESKKRGEKFAEQDAEIHPVLTNDISKNGCLRRTLRPGVRLNGECIFNEKVEVWRIK